MHPARNAAAAGRLHCLTTTRAGFSPRPANPRDTSLEDKSFFVKIKKGDE